MQHQHSNDDSSSLSQGDSVGRPPLVSPDLRSHGPGSSYAATPFAVQNPALNMRLAGRPESPFYQHQQQQQQQQQRQQQLPAPQQREQQQSQQQLQAETLLVPLQQQYLKQATAQHPHLAALQGGLAARGSGALSEASAATHTSHASAPAAMHGPGSLPASEPLLLPHQHYEALNRRSRSFSQVGRELTQRAVTSSGVLTKCCRAGSRHAPKIKSARSLPTISMVSPHHIRLHASRSHATRRHLE
jgi:hypothetical protein